MEREQPVGVPLRSERPGRRARVKQFLYDWAFPALGHPALWASPTRAEPIDGEHVLWHGTDYMGNVAASARMGRTMVELSILEGDFGQEEISELYRSSRPVSVTAESAIAHTPFRALSYWARRPEAPVVRLWRVRQSGRLRLSWLAGREAERPASRIGAPLSLAGTDLDSGAAETGRRDWTEAELRYSGGHRREAELRLYHYRRSPTDADPEPDNHPGEFEKVSVAGRTVHLAWGNRAYGPFDALMEDSSGTLRTRLLSSTGVRRGREWFLEALEELGAHDGLL